MTFAVDRAVLLDEFLDLSARLEGLRQLVPGTVVDSPERIHRWQNLYGEEVSKVLANRTVLAKAPALVFTRDLKQWIKEARQALTVV
ncbi:hypothetical protein [Streptacidiphilus neutrinimicus]|uniref:hypothetical protein n=1 Tax=Streptacidiphilus neutrinimicus TaxID=105420 RepID=UPI001269AFA9|nr:hypothetical protein [Streptacidiphilus neutrinimicus]